MELYDEWLNKDEAHYPQFFSRLWQPGSDIFFCPRLHLLVEFLPQPACRELRPRWVEQIHRVLWPWIWIRSRQEISTGILTREWHKLLRNLHPRNGPKGVAKVVLFFCLLQVETEGILTADIIRLKLRWTSPLHHVDSFDHLHPFQLEDGDHQCKVSSWSSMKRQQPKRSWQPVRRRCWSENYPSSDWSRSDCNVFFASSGNSPQVLYKNAGICYACDMQSFKAL